MYKMSSQLEKLNIEKNKRVHLHCIINNPQQMRNYCFSWSNIRWSWNEMCNASWRTTYHILLHWISGL